MHKQHAVRVNLSYMFNIKQLKAVIGLASLKGHAFTSLFIILLSYVVSCQEVIFCGFRQYLAVFLQAAKPPVDRFSHSTNFH